MSVVRHIGLVVSDLDRAHQFYQAVFDLTLVSKQRERGPYIDALVGLSDVNLSWVKLRDASGMVLELLCYASHPEGCPSAEQPYPAHRHGCSHVAFTVSDIEACCARIAQNQGKRLSPIQYSPDNRVKVAYCCDPEGILLEIVQDLGL